MSVCNMTSILKPGKIQRCNMREIELVSTLGVEIMGDKGHNAVSVDLESMPCIITDLCAH